MVKSRVSCFTLLRLAWSARLLDEQQAMILKRLAVAMARPYQSNSQRAASIMAALAVVVKEGERNG